MITKDRELTPEERYKDYAYTDLKFGDQDWRWCHKYAHDVVTGKIIAGKWIKLACKRHLNDLKRDDVYFDEVSAKSVVLWFKFIPITDGKDVGKSTKLFPWQIFFVCCLAGWKITESGLRKYKYAYAQVARKGGKSTLAGGLTLYFMYKSGYFRPRAYSVATKRDQAKILWSAAALMIRLSPRLKTIFKERANDILMPAEAGEFRPLASDSNSLDGLNPLVATLDECHAIKDRNLYGVMVSAFGAQDEGLMLTITTAGTVLDGICTDLNKAGKRVLQGDRKQDAYFYLMYEIDKGDKWDDEKNWYKANPALGFQPKIEYLRDRCIEASMSAAEKANFLTKHLNVFVSGSDKWLNMDEVKECSFDGLLTDPEYKGRHCVVGLDRAQVHDLTSFCILFPNEEGGADIFFKNFLPKKTMVESTDYLKEVYLKASENGNLELLPTSTVRDEPIVNFIRYMADNFDVEMFGYDPWHMREIAEDLEEEGLPMVAVSQGTGNMSEPAKKLEGLIKEATLYYNDNLFEFACSNAILKVTDQNNVKVVRENAKTDKIDPLISAIIALSCATLQKTDENPYEHRGLI
ncbi:MAG: terminase large subunit [Emcibacteraceae bacterium]|nr:terminase large subunit [Emcibacteraceae bacterium]